MRGNEHMTYTTWGSPKIISWSVFWRAYQSPFSHFPPRGTASRFYHFPPSVSVPSHFCQLRDSQERASRHRNLERESESLSLSTPNLHYCFTQPLNHTDIHTLLEPTCMVRVLERDERQEAAAEAEARSSEREQEHRLRRVAVGVVVIRRSVAVADSVA